MERTAIVEDERKIEIHDGACTYFSTIFFVNILHQNATMYLQNAFPSVNKIKIAHDILQKDDYVDNIPIRFMTV